MHPSRVPHVRKWIGKLAELIDLKGLGAIEVGADPESIVSNMLIEEGVKHVYSTSIWENWPNEKITNKISKRRADARDLPSVFDEESCDLVVGIAVLEHIDGIDELFAGTFKVLRPGGYAFLHGGPIWSGPFGHHVWVVEDDYKYCFTDNNPIPNWYHLINNENSMEEVLRQQGLPENHAENVARWTYNSPAINRMGFKDLLDSAERSSLEVIDSITVSGKKPDGELLNKIEQSKWRGQLDYSVTGLVLVLQKPK